MTNETMALFDMGDNTSSASPVGFQYKSLPSGARHGTYHAYGNLGCRCLPCRLAGRDRQKRQRNVVWDYKIGLACVDCGLVCGFGPGMVHPVAMDLDHKPGTDKRHAPAKTGKLSKAKRDAELEKCEPRCSNCHRVRTFERQESERKTVLGEWVD